MDLRIVTNAARATQKSTFLNPETDPWAAFMNEDPIALLNDSDVRNRGPVRDALLDTDLVQKAVEVVIA
jgi:hypothetical protein